MHFLQDVQLSFNEIKPSGACAIADALANKENLVRLDLDGNEFGEDCIEQVRSELGDMAGILGSFRFVVGLFWSLRVRI